MSDLQCAARFLVLPAVDDAAVDRLRDERVALVYDADPGAADELRTAAELLGVVVAPAGGRVSLVDVRDRAPAALDVLRDLADLHRGETVVVRVRGEGRTGLEVLVDNDGITVTNRPSAR